MVGALLALVSLPAAFAVAAADTTQRTDTIGAVVGFVVSAAVLSQLSTPIGVLITGGMSVAAVTMVLDELLPMLDSQDLDTSRVAFLGWSMGGYGALLLGGRLGPARTAAIVAVSPALWLSSGASAPGAFDGPEDFAANNVFGASRCMTRSVAPVASSM